ncbi:caspase family protein, partial [Klebsiella pneumoniae]|nr:caspase family protein [Klebsiella pneumoniae]
LGIPESQIHFVRDATLNDIRAELDWMQEVSKAYRGDASFVFYYAGHGIPDNKTKDAFLMPVDADGTDTEVCMSLNDLYDRINSRRLNQCVVFLDACFSGAQRGGEMIVAARGVKLKPKDAAPQGKTIVFSATSGDQAAFSHKEESHGLFTYFLLSKLQQSKGKVNLGDLADYLSDKVAFES